MQIFVQPLYILQLTRCSYACELVAAGWRSKKHFWGRSFPMNIVLLLVRWARCFGHLVMDSVPVMITVLYGTFIIDAARVSLG